MLKILTVQHNVHIALSESTSEPRPGGSVGWNTVPLQQNVAGLIPYQLIRLCFGFHPQLGHIWEATD